MKKNIFYIMLLLLTSAVSFTSCDDDSSAGVTSITYYPVSYTHLMLLRFTGTPSLEYSLML